MRLANASAKPPLLRSTGFCNVGLLAPDIQEAILDGPQAKRMQLEELTKAVPAMWRRSSKEKPQSNMQQTLAAR